MNSIFEFVELHIDSITAFFAILGGAFALYQWHIKNMYTRAKFVQELICEVRDDKDISMIMDIVDWDNGITYSGTFSVSEDVRIRNLNGIGDEELFKMIDKTLSHFSYICYLKEKRLIGEKDLCMFEYEIRRLADNPHIRNYLYTLYHWSKQLKVKNSFYYLTKYCLDKGYLLEEFRRKDSILYTCFLKLADNEHALC